MELVPTYGRLTVVGKRQGKKVEVRCECGVRKVIYWHNLVSGRTRSCGCLLAGGWGKQHHGAVYQCWRDMQYRCYRKRNKEYARYGGRGISVHPVWRGPAGFYQFLQDVGTRPGVEYTLDRINNDGDYAPGNVRWATRKTQMRNTSRARYYTMHGVSLSLRDWCERVGLSFTLVYQRIHTRGWSFQDAISRPSLR